MVLDRPLQMTPESSRDRPQLLRGGLGALRAANPQKHLSESKGYGLRHRLAGLLRKALGQLVGLRVFDVQAHVLPRYHIIYLGGFYLISPQVAT